MAVDAGVLVRRALDDADIARATAAAAAVDVIAAGKAAGADAQGICLRIALFRSELLLGHRASSRSGTSVTLPAATDMA